MAKRLSVGGFGLGDADYAQLFALLAEDLSPDFLATGIAKLGERLRSLTRATPP